jgi:DHA2 family multidrug resistance protein
LTCASSHEATSGGSIINVILGVGLYGVVFIIPLVPKLMQRFDARVVIGVGIFFFGSRSFFTSHLDSDFAGL